MYGFNALYEQTYQDSGVLSWRCIVDMNEQQIVEFGTQLSGIPADEIPDYDMMTGEYLTLDAGRQECIPIKQPEYDDIIFQYSNEEAYRDEYDIEPDVEIIIYDDEKLYDEEKLEEYRKLYYEQ